MQGHFNYEHAYLSKSKEEITTLLQTRVMIFILLEVKHLSPTEPVKIRYPRLSSLLKTTGTKWTPLSQMQIALSSHSTLLTWPPTKPSSSLVLTYHSPSPQSQHQPPNPAKSSSRSSPALSSHTTAQSSPANVPIPSPSPSPLVYPQSAASRPPDPTQQHSNRAN